MHTIRLGGPWTRVVNGESGRVTLPDDFLDEWVDRVVYCRRFHRPTNLADQRVFVAIEQWKGELNGLEINDQLVEFGSTSGRVDVTDHLNQFNELKIKIIAIDDCQPQLLGPVTIEIE